MEQVTVTMETDEAEVLYASFASVCALIKSANGTKLGRAIHTLESRAAIQRDMDRLEVWEIPEIQQGQMQNPAPRKEDSLAVIQSGD